MTNYTAKDGLPDAAIVSLFEDRSGDLWIGTFGGGVARLHAGRFQIFTAKDGLPHNIVLSISQDEKGVFWFGTRGGLARYGDGGSRRTGRTKGSSTTPSSAPSDDGHGYLWLTTNHGVFRVSLAELNGVAANPDRGVHPVEFATANGMRSAECNNAQHGVARGRDGRLWFATVKGLAMADPSHIQINRVPPAGRRRADSSPAGGTPTSRRARSSCRRSAGTSRSTTRRSQLPASRAPSASSTGSRASTASGSTPAPAASRTTRTCRPGSYRFQVAAVERGRPLERAAKRGSRSRSRRTSTTRPGSASRRVRDRARSSPRRTAARVAAAAQARGNAHGARRGEARTRCARSCGPTSSSTPSTPCFPTSTRTRARAKRMILQLADLLRASLKSEPGQLVTVDEELTILEQYTNIERTRFGDRIRVAVEVDAARPRRPAFPRSSSSRSSRTRSSTA